MLMMEAPRRGYVCPPESSLQLIDLPSPKNKDIYTFLDLKLYKSKQLQVTPN